MTRHYTFVDYATQGYITLVGFLVLLLHGPSLVIWPWLVLGHATASLLVHLLIVAAAKWPINRPLVFLRHYYPILLYGAFYRETGALNQMTHSGFLDPFFIRMEAMFFGGQPSVTFMQLLPYPLVSEIFYASYFSYYLMIGGVGLALFLKNRREFNHYISVVSFVFYVCYMTYIFTPVVGPPLFHDTVQGYTLPQNLQPPESLDIPAPIQAGLFYKVMEWIYEHLEAPGAAFPSSHVAVALVTLYFTFRYLRAVRFLHLVVVVLLAMATVYCRYHFVVDVIAGVLTALVLVPLGNWLFWRFEKACPGGVQAEFNPPAQTGRS